jgi:GTP cyclohydrolase I
MSEWTDGQLVWEGIHALLRLAGEDPDRPGLARTPARFLAAWQELTSKPGDPAELLATTFDDIGPVDEMIAVGPMEFVSMCEHHLMPFSGTAWVAYIPQDRIVGLSKLPRLVEHYARRLQVQERLTTQITAALDKYVGPLGSAALLRAQHSCAAFRGVRKNAPMVTSSLTGAFRQPEVRQEFLALARP